MHESERLLQLYAKHDSSKRTVLRAKIQKNLHNGKPLVVSFQELTGETLSFLSTDTLSANDFNSWVKKGKRCHAFLLYYVELLERIDTVVASKKQSVEAVSTPVSPELDKQTIIASIYSPVEHQINSSGEKKRYTAEIQVPSRSERAKYQRTIEPARPRKKSGAKRLGVFALIGLLVGGGYIGYPYVAALFEPSEQVDVNTPTAEPKPEPVAEMPEPTEVWLTEKNVSLLSEPNGTDVTYVGDIGDRYDVLEERDDHVLLDLGADVTAWAPLASTTAEWKSFTLSDQQVLDFLKSGVDQIYLERATVDEYLSFSETELYDVLGEPFGRDEDALNEYAFYTGIFFVIQDEAVHAIDWTNTPTTKEAFQQLGTPVYETDDAIVFESPKYSLRLFASTDGVSTRIRVTEK